MVDIAELIAKYPKHAAKYDPAAAFAQLEDSEAKTRLAGAKWIAKQAHGEVNNFTEYWLKDPQTLDRLLPALSDPEPLVVEEIIGAVKMIVSPQYRAAGRDDRRVIPRAIELLQSERANTRMRALLTLTNFDDPQLADVLLPLFDDPDKDVRALIAAEIATPAKSWPPAVQERVRQAALAHRLDRAMEVRINVCLLLVTVGQDEDVAPMTQGLKDIKGANYRTLYKDYLAMLKEARNTKK
jgi:hypothetical protein